MKWRYARVAGFEVLSDCSDSKTRAFLQCLLRSVPLMDLPEAFQPVPRLPHQIILSERFLENELGPGDGPAGLRALRVGDDGINHAIATDSDLLAVRVGLARWSPQTSSIEVVSLPLLFIPHLLQGHTPALPAWALEGLSGLHDSGKSQARSLELLMSYSAGHADFERLRDASNRPERLPPIADLFSEAVPPRDSALHARWRAQAVLFARWALYRRDAPQEKFWEFVARASLAPVTEAMFRECFAAGLDATQRELAAFLGTALDEPVLFRALELTAAPPVTLRDAKRAEVCRIEGEWQRLTAQSLRARFPKLSAIYLARARRTLEHAANAGDRDPQLLAALGLCHFDAGESERARQTLEEAFAQKAVRPLALRALARLHLAEANRAPEGAEGKHSPAQTLRMLRALYAARAQPPADAETYGLLAAVWGQGQATPFRKQLGDLREAEKFYPRESALLLAIARLGSRHGFHAEAIRTAERGLMFATSQESRDEFAGVIAAAGAAAK